MRKRNYLKRLLTFVLMAAMLVGMVNMPAKAAEVAKVQVNGFALDGDYLYPRYMKEWNSWFIYFKTDVDIPGAGDVTLTLQNGTNQFTAQACRGDNSGAGLKWLLVRISAQYLPIDADTTISVKKQTLTFADGASMELQAFSFNLSGGVWSMAGKKVMPNVKYKAQLKLGTSWDANFLGNTTTFYLYTEDNQIYYQDPDQYDTKMNCIDTDEDKTVYYGSRLWKWQKQDDGTYKSTGYSTNEVIHFARRTYSVNVGTVTEGDIYQFQGYYQDKDGNTYGFFPVRVKYENGAWAEITDEIVEKHSGYLNVNQADWALNADTSKALHLQGSDAYLSGCQENWTTKSANLSAVDGTITVNGKAADVAEIQKYHGISNCYFLRFNTDVEKDAILTIEGTFKAEKTLITFEKSQFKWDGTKWSDVAPYSGTLVTTNESGAQIDSTRTTGLYMKSSDTYMSERTYEDWDDNDIKMVAADENSGVYIDGVRNADAQMWKYNTQNGYYYLASVDLTNVNKVVIKGNFKTLEGRYALSVEEAVFTWNGSKFVNGTTESAVSVTLTPHFNNGWYAPTLDTNAGGWRVYFYTSDKLLGASEDRYTLKLTNGTTTEEVVFTQSNSEGNEMYAYLPTTLVDGTYPQTITTTAGTYKAEGKDYAVTLSEDQHFYITKYGWSSNVSMVTPTTAPVSFTLSSGNNAGIYLTADVDDTVPFDETDWGKGTVLPICISQETYGVKSGVARNDTLTEVYMMKIAQQSYYVALSDKGQSASAGDVYTIKGMFRHTDGQSIACTELKVTWDGTKWTQLYSPLEDTCVKYDVNADSTAPTVKDLVALLKYNADNTYRINTAQADINNDGKIDKEDVGTLRRIIVGSVSYQNGKVYGMPTYTIDRTIEKAAYASVSMGTLADDGYTISNERSDTEIDADMQKYKEAGLTLLISEEVAYYSDDSTYNTGIQKYLEAAERNGLGVLVFSNVIQYMLTNGKGPEIYNNSNNGWTWQAQLDHDISTLRSYSKSAFKGFMVWDEIRIQYAEYYNMIVGYLNEKYPELLIQTAQLPTRGYEYDDPGPGAYTLDTTLNNTKELAYKDYIRNMTKSVNMFEFDFYPLRAQTSDSGYSDYEVVEDWFLSHKYVADIAKEQNYNFEKAVTIQSSELPSNETNGWWLWEKGYVYYAPEKVEDIGFSVYTSMAYGVKRINYFTYNLHHNDGTTTESMATNSNIYNAVQTINKQIDKFANVYQAFSWRDTIDIAAGKTGSFTTDNNRLKSASVTGARTLIGYMVDTDGFDGYMIANANGPRKTTGTVATAEAKVNLEFNEATKVLIYDFAKGTKEVRSVSGTVDISVPVGGGIMVISLR